MLIRPGILDEVWGVKLAGDAMRSVISIRVNWRRVYGSFTTCDDESDCEWE